jgi:hypothetical protein
MALPSQSGSVDGGGEKRTTPFLLYATPKIKTPPSPNAGSSSRRLPRPSHADVRRSEGTFARKQENPFGCTQCCTYLRRPVPSRTRAHQRMKNIKLIGQQVSPDEPREVILHRITHEYVRHEATSLPERDPRRHNSLGGDSRRTRIINSALCIRSLVRCPL